MIKIANSNAEFATFDLVDLLLAIKTYRNHRISDRAFSNELSRGNKFAVSILFDEELQSKIFELSEFDVLEIDSKRLYEYRKQKPRSRIIVFDSDSKDLEEVVRFVYEKVENQKANFIVNAYLYVSIFE